MAATRRKRKATWANDNSRPRHQRCWQFAGIAALCGCIYIPTFGIQTKGKDLTDEVGNPGSKALLVVAHSTIADALRVLGTPEYASEDGKCIAYAWTKLDALMIGLCSGSVARFYALILTFDDRGQLQGSEITKIEHFPGEDRSAGPFVLDRRANDEPLPKAAEHWRPPALPRPGPSATAHREREPTQSRPAAATIPATMP